jgi:hypothetical protein
MRCRWCLLRQHFELCVLYMSENDRMPDLHISSTSTDEKLNLLSATLEELSATCRNAHAGAVGGLVRRRYRRRPRARGRLHALSGVRKHRATLRAAELRPASPPKLSVKKRAPPPWNRCKLEKGRARWIDEDGRWSAVSSKILWKTHIRVGSFNKLQIYLRVCDERSNPSRHWTKPQCRRFLVVVGNYTYFHRKRGAL